MTERVPITIYSQDDDVLGMFNNWGVAVPAAPSTTGTMTRYFDEDLKAFFYAEVLWDGALPDQHGGKTKGEILQPLFPDDALQQKLMGAPARSMARFWSRGSDENED